MPPLPGGGFNGGLSTGAPLSIIYQGEKHGITKDRFVIGRDNLRLVQPVVRAYCLEKEIAYTEASLVGSYAIVIRYLNVVGLGERDPFSCPFVAEFR